MRRRKGQAEADIASRKSSKGRKLEGEFLEGTESSFDSVETMANEGFNDAWNETADPAKDASLDAAIDVGQKDTLDDLDKSLLKRIVIGLVAVAALGAGAFWISQRVVEETAEAVPRALSESDPNILASPIDERAYEPATGPAVIDESAVIDQWFVDVGSAGSLIPRPANALGVESPDIAAATQATTSLGTVFWAGRLHVAIVSDRPLFNSTEECGVVSMAAADLSSVDVAGIGQCDDEFAATGDRLACSGTNVVLVEVWPRNPDSVNEQPPVDSVRVRIEYEVGEYLVSQRGILEIAADGEDPVASAAALTGEPGDVVQIEVNGQAQNCELIDRSGVDVRLLPG